MTVLREAGHWEPYKVRRLAPHRNLGLEIVYVLHGQPVWQVEGRAEPVPAGAVFFTLPWQEHGGISEREPGCELFYAVIRMARTYRRRPARAAFHPELGFSPREEGQILQLLMGAEQHAFAATPALAWLVRRLVHERHSQSLLAGSAGAALARLAVIELARCAEQGRRPADPDSDAGSRVAAFLRTLETRCAEPWTIDAMASACGLARTRFAQLVKRQTGDPPIMALNRLRIHQAQRVLARTDRPITQIGFDCGFSSTQYFARVFREYTGVRAREYRVKCRGGGHTVSP